MTETLFVEHPACALVRLRNFNMSFEGLCASWSTVVTDRTKRWNQMLGRVLGMLNGSLDGDLLLYLASQCWCSLQLSDLIMNVLSVISWHFHALIEIIKCWVRHLKCFIWNCGYTSQISLIALVLQDCFLSQFNPVLFFKFLYQSFQELLLSLQFLYLRFDLDCNVLFHFPFIHSVSCNLWVQFPVSNRSEE